MYKDYRYINAGTNEIYRWGKKAQEKARKCMTANKAGYISIPVDGDKYWTLGTSTGKYGEFCKINGVCFSVNRAGYAYAKADTDKGEALIAGIKAMLTEMGALLPREEED